MRRVLVVVLLSLAACSSDGEEGSPATTPLPNDECEALCVQELVDLEPECVEEQAACVIECGSAANLDCVLKCGEGLECGTYLASCSEKCECRTGEAGSEEELQCLEEFEFSPLDCAYRCQSTHAMCRAECEDRPVYDEAYSTCMDGCSERVVSCETDCLGTFEGVL